MQELKSMKIWLCWRFEKNKQGKITKVPYSVTGRRIGTSLEYEKFWVTNDGVASADQKKKFDGIGFILPAGYFLLDIDDRSLDDPLAKELLARFSTYMETSVSGHGIHVIGKCDLDKIPTETKRDGKLQVSSVFYVKNPNNHVELYIGGRTDRYATFSGKAISDVPVQDCTDAVLETLEKNMRRSGSAFEPNPNVTGKPSDQDQGVELTPEEMEFEAAGIITALRNQKNGDKFSRLYDRGDTSGYGSQSEADLALCTLIAYRAGNDPALVDNIFRSSALYRDKWEREDYREETIRKGILFCQGRFHPAAMEHPSFIRFEGRNNKPVLVPSLLAQYIRETIPMLLVQNNGKESTMVFVYQDGCYRYCSKDMMCGIIKEPVEAYNVELVSMPKINEVYNQLITDRQRVSQVDLNADEHLINFQNGLLEITSTGLALMPHSPEVLSTIQIPCAWTGEETPTPVFDQYMRVLTNNNPEITRLLLQFIGVCISNVKGWRTKKSLFMVGPGDTGKSVLKSLVEKILGDNNSMAIDLQEIEARFGTSAIYGTRLAGSSDMSYMSINELKTFKKLTGGDGIFAEHKGKDGFRYTFSGLLWFCMNRLAKFGGDDGRWVYERIMVVHCGNVIPKEEQDKMLLDKLYAEREGIIFKAIQALQTVIANGYRFSEPDSVIAAREAYMEENNTVIEFYKERMTSVAPGKHYSDYTTGEIYEEYKNWCKDNNYGHTKTAKEFRDTLAAYLGTTVADMTVHTERGSCYRNITLAVRPGAQRDFYCTGKVEEDYDFLQ